jgi:benzoate transport
MTDEHATGDGARVDVDADGGGDLPEEEQTPEQRRYARKAVFASSIGYALDGFDLLILSFALSGITATFALSDSRAGSLATITLIGAMVGGLVFGMLADRVGRVKMLTYSIVIFAVFTGLTALAQSYWDLAAYRFIAGIGIGGEFGIGMTLAAEAVSAKYRARATSWVAIGFQTGVLAAALVSAPVIGLWGWRGLFVIGALPALVAVLVRRHTEESPTFEAEKARRDAAGKSLGARSLLGLVRTPRIALISLAMIIITSVQNFGYFGLMTWLPSYLNTEFELDLVGSALWVSVTILGMMLGIIAFGQLADRIGRRYTFWIFQLGSAVFVILYAMITVPWMLLPGGFVVGIFVNGALGGYGALLAELYPTEIRATAQNVLFNIGRGIGGFGPFVIPLIAEQKGFPWAIGSLSVLYCLSFVTMLLIPERRGARLE